MPEPAPPYSGSAEHLFDELRRVDLMVRRAMLVVRRRASGGQAPGEFDGLIVTDAQVNDLTSSDDLLSEPWAADPDAQSRLETLDQAIEGARAAIDARVQAGEAAGRQLTLPRLARLCALSMVEIDLLLVALAPEFEPRYETLYSYLQDDATRRRPSVDLALNLVCRSKHEKTVARALVGEGGALRHFHLMELHEDLYDRHATLLRRFLKVNDSVIRYLLEQNPTGLKAGEVLVPHEVIGDVDCSPASQGELRNLAEALERTGLERSVVELQGAPGAPLDAAARALGHALNRPLMWVQASRLPAEPADMAAFVRDAALWNTVIVLRRPDEEFSEDEGRRLRDVESQFWTLVANSDTPVIVVSREGVAPVVPGRDSKLWRVTIEPPDFDMRRQMWETALGDSLTPEDAVRLADMFPYPAERARQVVALAWSRAAIRHPSAPRPTFDDVLAAGRSALAPHLRRFASLGQPRFGWTDIVLPEDKDRQLRAVASRVTHRRIVQYEWAFGEKLARGLATSVLFAGPSGTGKTMAAEVLAKELGLDLVQIDLSAVVSKYIGETEKNLSVIFREAEFSQCLLFFDEADALFGKRTEVKDAHDRYANIEVNYLLQRIEHYQGLVVLATNFQKNVDEAFMRRLGDVIEFPFPDERLRERIWRQHFPPQAPVHDDVDFLLLAQQFKVPGGKIRNAVLNAAYLAAEEGGSDGVIRMAHLLAAIKGEFQKEGKLVMKGDMGPFRPTVESSAR